MHIAKNIEKDNRRDMTEKTTSAPFAAPHAGISGVGFEEEPWDPSEIAQAEQANERRAGVDADAAPVDKLKKFRDPSRATDVSLKPEKKGRDKSGGALMPLEKKAAQGSIRQPLKPKNDTGNEIQFTLNRKKKTIGDRLAQITELRNIIAREMDELEALRREEKLLTEGADPSSAASVPSRASRKGKKSKPSSSASASAGAADSGKVAVGTAKDAVRMLSASGAVAAGASSDDESVQSRGSNASKRSVRSTKQQQRPPKTAEGAAAAATKKKEELVQEAARELTADEIELKKKQDALEHELKHFEDKDSRILTLKENQRLVTQQERSREIERKRRLLTETEGRRRGPPPENEPESVYDYFAMVAQTCVRGWLARRHYAWYKVAVVRASTLMQMIVRGCMARIRVGRLLVRSRAAREIQRTFRGMSARVSGLLLCVIDAAYFVCICLAERMRRHG
jgi:hypothetical protein